ncbi:hypothetical protein [Cupriavidus basilensis]
MLALPDCQGFLAQLPDTKASYNANSKALVSPKQAERALLTGTRCTKSFEIDSRMHRHDHQILPAMAPPSEAQRLRDRASAILWVKSQMAKHRITMDSLIAAGCFTTQFCSSAGTQPSSSISYRDADGHTWNGEGNLPEWLQRAVNAGQTPEFFKVS